MRKKIIIGIILTVSGVVLSVGIYYTWLITPPSLPKTAQEGLKTINSSRYQRMPDYRKTEHIEQTRKLMEKMPQDKRAKLFKNVRTDKSTRQALRTVRRNVMMQRAADYAKASPEERLIILDETIDRMEQRRALRERQRRDGGDSTADRRRGTRGRRRGQMRERIKQRIEKGNPQRTGLRGEYFNALRERRKQRGLPEFRHRRR